MTGWHLSVEKYRHKCIAIVQAMHSSLDEVLDVNRTMVKAYLASISMSRVELLLQSLKGWRGRFNKGVYDKVSQYPQKEEDRIRGSLEAIAYEIDAPSTLSLITGPGRIERVSVPCS